MQIEYITEHNEPAKMFRETFYATGEMVAVGIMRLLQDGVKREELTTRKIKDKMHELLYNYGMGAFTDSASAHARTICKELYPAFYEKAQAPAAAPKKADAPKKGDTKKDAAPKKDKPTPKAKDKDAAPATKKPAAATNPAFAASIA